VRFSHLIASGVMFHYTWVMCTFSHLIKLVTHKGTHIHNEYHIHNVHIHNALSWDMTQVPVSMDLLSHTHTQWISECVSLHMTSHIHIYVYVLYIHNEYQNVSHYTRLTCNETWLIRAHTYTMHIRMCVITHDSCVMRHDSWGHTHTQWISAYVSLHMTHV